MQTISSRLTPYVLPAHPHAMTAAFSSLANTAGSTGRVRVLLSLVTSYILQKWLPIEHCVLYWQPFYDSETLLRCFKHPTQTVCSKTVDHYFLLAQLSYVFHWNQNSN